jgi:hypothetical protein
MRFAVAGLMLLLAAAPAADPKSTTSTCKDRLQVQYKACLKRTTTKKGRAQCKVDRNTVQRTCR